MKNRYFRLLETSTLCSIILFLATINFAKSNPIQSQQSEKSVQELKLKTTNDALPNAFQFKLNSTSTIGATKDFYGQSVAISGNYAIVGVPRCNVGTGTNTGSGEAIIYYFSGSWNYVKTLTPSDSSVGDCFGFSVAISGDYAIVGAYQADNTDINQGQAYIFHRLTTPIWSETAILRASDKTPDAQFGWSVGISGNHVIVGAPKAEPIGGVTNEGQAYVFERSGLIWNQATTILKSALTPINAHDQFGFSVGISGNRAIVGTPLHDEPGSKIDVGVAHIFQKSAPLNWIHTKKILHPNGKAQDYFGFSVAISQTTVAIGAPQHEFGIDIQGAVFIYTGSGSVWNQQGSTLKGVCCNQGDNFGWSVSLDGDTLIVGASYDNAGIVGNQVNDTGSAFIFTRNGAVWNQTRQLTDANGIVNDLFGTSVAVSGNKFLVGSPNSDISANTDQGSVFAYYDDSTPVINNLATGSVVNDESGYSVAISGERAVVGSPGANGSKGKVYVFKKSGGTWVLEQTLAGSVFGRFGHSVAISDDKLIVGAPHTTVGTNTFQGAAYVFMRTGSQNSMNPWTPQGMLTEPGSPDDNYGWSVGISCDTAIVGVPRGNIAPNQHEGVAYIYTRSGFTWNNLQAKISANAPATSELFGESVGIYKDFVVVGSPNYSGLKGRAYFFSRTGTTWSSATIIGTGQLAGDRLGSSVAISSNMIAVGIPYKNVGSNNWQGAVNVYRKNHPTSFTLAPQINDPTPQAGGRFGMKVGISGDRLIVGSIAKEDSPNIIGEAHIYNRIGTSWTLQGGTLMSTTPGTNGDYFPINVAIDGNYAMASRNPISDTGINYAVGDVFIQTDTMLKTQQKLTN